MHIAIMGVFNNDNFLYIYKSKYVDILLMVYNYANHMYRHFNMYLLV